jgi:hypothetical protein
MPSNVTRRPPTLSVNELRGAEIPKGPEKVAETVSSRIELSTEISPGFFVPDFKLSPRTVKDPEPRDKIIDVPPERLSQVRTAEDFKTLLSELQDTNKSYLLPERGAFSQLLGEDTHFAYNNVTGRRVEKFFDEAQNLISRTGLRGAEATAARKALNLAHNDAYRGRDIKFDRADTSSYWSYSNDAPFVHVYEKMLDALPPGDARRESIQNQIDYIFTHKYTIRGGVQEEDAEKSLGLVAIDKKSRNTVSIAPNTLNSTLPSYETIQIKPNAGGPHAGKHVLWDNKTDKYYFEGTRQEVPAELHSKFDRRPVDKVVFRRAQEGEQLREGFNFDWNSNRMINQDKIDTSWWGHCDIQALMETIHTDMKNTGNVNEYRADSGKTTEYKRADLLEAMSSTLNMGSEYIDPRSGQTLRLGQTQFGGARNDERPDNIHLNVGGRYQSFNVRINNMSEPNKPDTRVDMNKSFSEYQITEDGRGFKKNEEFMQKNNGDVHIIDGAGRKIEARNEYYTVNANGQWVENKDAITIDPEKDEKMLLGTSIRSIENRSLTRHYYNPKTQELSSAEVSFKRGENGKYEAVESNMRSMGVARGMLLGREMQSGDDPEGKASLTDGAIRTGNSIATDSSKGSQVWNGVVYGLREDVAWRSDDGKFEKIEIRADSRYGSNLVGSKINELDNTGKIVRTHEIDAPVDFYWRDIPRVSPVIAENGKWYVNKAMYERGLIDSNNIKTSLDGMRDLNDLLYLGLNSKDSKPVYTIVHEGKRLVYNDETTWKADIAKLEASPTAKPDKTAFWNRFRSWFSRWF